MADYGEFIQIRSYMPTLILEPADGIFYCPDSIWCELSRWCFQVGLITRKNDNISSSHNMVDPGSIDPGVHSTPAMIKYYYRSPFRFGVSRFKDPVFFRTFSIYLPGDCHMGIIFSPRTRRRLFRWLNFCQSKQ